MKRAKVAKAVPLPQPGRRLEGALSAARRLKEELEVEIFDWEASRFVGVPAAAQLYRRRLRRLHEAREALIDAAAAIEKTMEIRLRKEAP